MSAKRSDRRRSPSRKKGQRLHSRGALDARMAFALHEVAGPAMILDEQLRVIELTPGLERLVGPIERGVAAPKQLCGESTERPVAEALARGEAIAESIVRPGADGQEHTIEVRAVPLHDGRVRCGWLLLFDPEPWPSDGPDAPVHVYGILTRDAKVKALLRDVQRIARGEASVLVRGETGTGKELVARALHAASPRAAGPFRALNCAALPAQLLESELFGHVRGAFTGAVRDAPGHLRAADGGTLFLDEIAELSLELQAKLLRVLQERSVIPVGGREAIPVDVRFVAATHRSLRAAVDAGRFRADLMYRVRVIPLFIPPLRDRRGDIGLLAWHFAEGHNARGLRRVARIAPGALARLEQYDWPGNVRELQNAIEYAFAIGEGPVLTEAELPPEVRGIERGGTAEASEVPPKAVDEDPLPFEARRLVRALERANGSRRRAAESLGISRTTLWRKLRQFGLE